jgi:hypothetical protein
MKQVLILIFIFGALTGYSQTYSSVINDSTIASFINQTLICKTDYPGTKLKKRVMSQPLAWENARWDLNSADLNDSIFQEKFFFVMDTLKKYFNESNMPFLEKQFKSQIKTSWIKNQLNAKFRTNYDINYFEYTIPIFSNDYQTALIYEYYYCGNLCAYSGLWLYKRNGREWVRYKCLKGWIS